MTEEAKKLSIQIGHVEGEWELAVFERCGPSCQGCGAQSKCRAYPIVPFAQGGKKVPSNGTVLCRLCHREVVHLLPEESKVRVFKLETSAEQYEFCVSVARRKFKSISNFFQHLIQHWLQFGDGYELLQDLPIPLENDLNTSMPRDVFSTFVKKLKEDYTVHPAAAAQKRGKQPMTLSASAALRWLIDDYRKAELLRADNSAEVEDGRN